MQRALTAEQTRRLEERVMASLDVDVAELMRRVGIAVAREARLLSPDGRVVVTTGAGNNAGDGWVAARELHATGRDTFVLSLSDPEDLPEPARSAAADAASAGVEWSVPDSVADVGVILGKADLIVDALFGFGVHGALREPFASAVEAMGDADAPVLAVDLPSGVESDTGRAAGAAVAADWTLAVLTRKIAHVQEPGRSLAGDIRLLTLDVEPAVLDEPGALEIWDPLDVAHALPIPGPTDHKGTRGRVLVVGGSVGMTGAVALAGWGALRTGAGFVTLALPASLVDVVDEAVMPAVVLPLPETPGRAPSSDALATVLEASVSADVVVLGPGMGRAPETAELGLEIIRSCKRPLVVDADALDALAGSSVSIGARTAPTILTPHPGEAGRLLGVETAAVQADRVGAARELARSGATVALKGPGTLVTATDRQAVAGTGTAALATMGTGDVLAGSVGALAATGMDPFDATYVAVYVHGVAGEVAAEGLTEAGVTALDVAHALPAALRGVSEALR